MGRDFYTTLTDLARLGAAGVGIAIFLMIFFLLVRGKPLDEAAARLREKFLVYGVGFAVFCGILSIVTPLLERKPVQGGPVKLRLAFSPDFGSEKLTPPKVQLPDGTESEPGKVFTVPVADVPQVVTIGMDGPLKEIRNLRTATTALAASVATVQSQRDKLAASVPAASAPPQAKQQLDQNASRSELHQQEVVRSLSRGDFEKAAVASRRLQSQVTASTKPVDQLARPVI
jgi:hypothetical protein